jgi:hypothetical protein
MRLTLSIDDKVLSTAKEALGARSAKSAIVRALRKVAELNSQKPVIAHKGKLNLDVTADDILKMRDDR